MHPTDVQKVRARQRELGIPESFEWVAETTPSLRAAAEESGLVVHEHPLMVLDPGAPAADVDGVSGKLSVRIVGADDPILPGALAVPHLAFAGPGPRSVSREHRTYGKRSTRASPTDRWNVRSCVSGPV
ncbi:hypothetical protein ABZ613_14235 [Streptomyces collinus]|uniref:hypothetical protein n=1 Tax=Streptomyces collinus TaxID=42684 RepID=UPI0034000ABE